MGVDQKVDCTQRILRGAALKKYKAVLLECKKSEKEFAGNKWELSALKCLSTDNLWAWAKKDSIGYDRDVYLGLDK